MFISNYKERVTWAEKFYLIHFCIFSAYYGTQLALNICLINNFTSEEVSLWYLHWQYPCLFLIFPSVFFSHENVYLLMSFHLSCHKYNQLKVNHSKKLAIIPRHICIKKMIKRGFWSRWLCRQMLFFNLPQLHQIYNWTIEQPFRNAWNLDEQKSYS